MVFDLTGIENSMEFLADTDHEYAELKSDVQRSEILRKRVRARAFLTSEGNNDVRKAAAEIHQEVVEADELWLHQFEDFEKLRAKRQHAELYIEVWRSVEASRRKA